jgi:group II intron reverse transcriptase/maturase
MEMFVASRLAERLGGNEQLLERIVERRNVLRAMNQVTANKGAPGVDGMKTNHLKGYLKRHWPKIKQDLLNGTYRPLPVRSKQIDKPDGGVRLLGIPTVLDRLIQHAIAQVVEQVWDPTFSEDSYGFRPGRCAHDAVLKAKRYLLDGYTHVVDMDLSKFFDRVNHDRLMSRLAIRIRDKRVLKLIRRYLTAGTMAGGLVSPGTEGTTQGGPLSPLLSNIVLDELDKELESRGHKFVRYADDFRIYCKSQKAAERVDKSITKFITVKLKLKVNKDKSAVSRPWLRKFLGFTFISMCGQTKIRIHKKTISRFKDRVRELTNRNQGKSLSQIIKDLNQYLVGWWNYYRLTEARYLFKSLKVWIIRRLRCVVWKQWKNPRTRVRNLEKLGIAHKDAMLCGNARKKYWRMSKVKWAAIALPPRYFFEQGLFLPAQ